MLRAAATAAAPAFLAATVSLAEMPPGCDDADRTHMMLGVRGEDRLWVEFYSAPLPHGGRFDRWTLRHCRSGHEVTVTGFPPFPLPDDNAANPPDPAWEAGLPAHRERSQIVDGYFPTRMNAKTAAGQLTARLKQAGIEAVAGRGDRQSCVCDPVWRE